MSWQKSAVNLPYYGKYSCPTSPRQKPCMQDANEGFIDGYDADAQQLPDKQNAHPIGSSPTRGADEKGADKRSPPVNAKRQERHLLAFRIFRHSTNDLRRARRLPGALCFDAKSRGPERYHGVPFRDPEISQKNSLTLWLTPPWN